MEAAEANTKAASPTFLKGVEEFNRGEFYRCHETFEALWLAEPRPVRCLYQGILQIGVAFYHLRAGRYRPAVTLLERGSGYLRPFRPRYLGVDIAQLLADTAHCLTQVQRLGPDRLADFDWSLVPTIRLATKT